MSPVDGHTDLNPGLPGPWQGSPGPGWAVFTCWGGGGQEPAQAGTPCSPGGGGVCRGTLRIPGTSKALH